jgi:hypothetical protein
VKPAPPVELHIASGTQSSVFAVQALVIAHVRVLLHGSPLCTLPAGQLHVYAPIVCSLQVPIPQRPSVQLVIGLQVPPEAGPEKPQPQLQV